MKSERREQLDDHWLESLLHSAYQGDAQQEKRIAQVVQQLSALEVADADQLTGPEPVRLAQVSQVTRSPWYSMRNISALAIAASLMLLAVFWFDNSQQRAYAAVARSAQAAPVTRMYRLQMLVNRPVIGQREITAQLYINPDNRFVIQHPNILGRGATWIGGDATQRWIVPPRGPAVVAREQLLGGWLAMRDNTAPYLYLNTILDRMARLYHLEMLPDESLTDAAGQAIACVHVRGELLMTRSQLPHRIELWANSETGVAERLILRWPTSSDRPGPQRWIFARQSLPANLPANWFELEAHAGQRRVIRPQATAELNQDLEKELEPNE